MKSIFPELGKDPEPSLWVNLMNYVLSESPKFKTLGHPTVETAEIRNLDFVTATRAKNCTGLRRVTEKDDRLGYTHDFETMSKMTDYHIRIKNSEIETRETLSGKLRALKIFNGHYQPIL